MFFPAISTRNALLNSSKPYGAGRAGEGLRSWARLRWPRVPMAGLLLLIRQYGGSSCLDPGVQDGIAEVLSGELELLLHDGVNRQNY